MRNFEVPLSFGIALGQNETAMAKFRSMSEEEKSLVVDRAHSITTQHEMKSFVKSLVDSIGF